MGDVDEDEFDDAVVRKIPNPPPIPDNCDQAIVAGGNRGLGLKPGSSGKHHESHILLAACGVDQEARESAKKGGGIFTTQLLRLLERSEINHFTYTSLMHKLYMPKWYVY